MKKRRDILEARREDSRITSLEGKLQRVASQAEAYRRFVEREDVSASKNQLEQVQSLLQEEQKKVTSLESLLEQEKSRWERERSSMEGQHATAISRLTDELTKLQGLLIETEARNNAEKKNEAKQEDNDVGELHHPVERIVGPATAAKAAQLKQLENELRLSQIALKQSERLVERERRRADRAEDEVEELRAMLEDVKREQRVKDSQLDAMRTELQDFLQDPLAAAENLLTPRTSARRSLSLASLPLAKHSESKSCSSLEESKNDALLLDLSRVNERMQQRGNMAEFHEQQDGENEEDEEEYDDALASELNDMRESYEKKIQDLQTKLESSKKEIKSLNEEIGSLRGGL